MNNKIDLRKKVASLESKLDMLETELTYLNALLIDTGFPNGIETLKETALEILAEQLEDKHVNQKNPLQKDRS